MADLIRYPDAAAECARVLRIHLGARSEIYAQGSLVRTRVPSELSLSSPELPVVVCQVTAAVEPSVVNQRTSLQVTAWHVTDDEAHDLAQLCLGLVRASPGPLLRAVRPLAGVITGRDPDNAVPIAWFTIRAQVAPL